MESTSTASPAATPEKGYYDSNKDDASPKGASPGTRKDINADAVEVKPSIKKSKLPILKVFGYCGWIDYLLILISIIFNLASGVILPIFLIFFGNMLDSITEPTSTNHPMIFYIRLQLYCGAVSFGCCFIGALTMEMAAERQLKALKMSFVDSVLRQDMKWFDQFKQGELASDLNQACATIRDAIGLKFAQVFMFTGMFVGGYAVGIYKGWKLALVVSSALPVIALCSGYFFSMVGNADAEARKAYSGAGGIVEEALLGIRTVISFGLEKHMLNRYTAALRNSYKNGLRSSVGVGLGIGLTMGTIFLTYSLGFWYGGKLIADNHESRNCLVETCTSGGMVIGVFFCVLIAGFALGQAAPNISAVMKAAKAADDLSEIIQRQPEIRVDSKSGRQITSAQLTGQVDMQNVTFAYPTRPELNVFSQLNLSIPAGESVALVGSSGCGKSTCVQLIERFYDVNAGSVRVDGVDIRDYNLTSLRECIGMVSQEPRLFASTILENIKAGNSKATEAEVIEAAKRANAHDFITTFPDGYSTFVGEGGGQLSGGQKQRIAIARAILKNPAILILDEATSALDNESERIVQETLDNLLESQKRTTIIIAHRFSAIRKAHRIIVLDNPNGTGAKVVENGTHAELMSIQDGLYRELVLAQENTVEQTDAAADIETMGGLAEQFSQDMPRKTTSIINLKKKYSKDLSKAGSVDWAGLRDEKKAVPPKKQCGLFRKTFKLLSGHWLMVLSGLIGAGMNGCVFPCLAIALGKIMLAFYNYDTVRSDARLWAFIYLAFAGGVTIANFLQHASFGWAGQKIVHDLRIRLFESILHQDIEFFDDPQNTSGVLSEMLATDPVQMKGWIGDNTGVYFQNIAALICAIIVSFTASPKLAGVGIAAICMMAPASIAETYLFSTGSKATMRDDKNAGEVDYDSMGFLLQEVIVNIKIVHSFTLQRHFRDRFKTLVVQDYNTGFWNGWLLALVWGISQFTQFAAQSLCLWYGGRLVEKREINSDQMMRAIFGLLMAGMGMGQSTIFATDSKKAREAAERVYGVIDRKRHRDARETTGKAITSINDSIHFDAVNFRYVHRVEVPIYRNITLNIPKGRVVALVGASGCGKSTVVQILERFYDVGDHYELFLDSNNAPEASSPGSVKIDGVDIKEYNLKQWRECIGLVGQEPVLFTTTVKENIALGGRGQKATDEEIMAAARLANAEEFINSFPEKYDTDVGKMGGQLSGGQKQRVAIARAMIRNPSLLILDEATSALDPTSEKVVQEALDKLLVEQKRTTIVIAHRLSTVRKADKIIVLANKGKGSVVAEEGTHEQLMNIEGGVYRNLVEIAQQR